MIADLSRRAYEYRAQVLRMVYGTQIGPHRRSVFDCRRFLTCLYFHQLRLDPANPHVGGSRPAGFFEGSRLRDALHRAWRIADIFPVSELPTFRQLNSHLQGHPEPQKTPGVEVAAGPLGHGVAIAAGMALAARMDGSRRRIYAVLGDGELNSGVIWEGLMVGAKFGAR